MVEDNSKYDIESNLFIKCLQHFVYLNAKDEINALIEKNEINWKLVLELSKKHSVQLPLFHVLIFNRIKNIPTSFLKQWTHPNCLDT